MKFDLCSESDLLYYKDLFSSWENVLCDFFPFQNIIFCDR